MHYELYQTFYRSDNNFIEVQPINHPPIKNKKELRKFLKENEFIECRNYQEGDRPIFYYNGKMLTILHFYVDGISHIASHENFKPVWKLLQDNDIIHEIYCTGYLKKLANEDIEEFNDLFYHNFVKDF